MWKGARYFFALNLRDASAFMITTREQFSADVVNRVLVLVI